MTDRPSGRTDLRGEGGAADGPPQVGAGRRFGLTERQIALVLLFVAPAMFASNMLVARATHDLVPPVGLAFWRWTATFVLLMPFAAVGLLRHRDAVLREWRDLLALGALGMGMCGAFVYIGADTTTATNIGLIYAASPILIVVGAAMIYHERMTPRQALGVGLSLLGVLIIVCRGDVTVLSGLRFAVGDLWILGAMAAWAAYSLLLRFRPSALPPMVRFAAIVAGGVLVLLPFAVAETAWREAVTLNLETLLAIGFLALVASFGAYQVYGWIQRILGAGPTSLLMYLVPLYNGVLAYVLLGERLQVYHLLGAALVLPGIYLTTRKHRRA